VKVVLLEMLEIAGAAGLNAAIAVSIAAKREMKVDRTTLSSLLSRLKADGIVDHDGYRYRLAASPNKRALNEIGRSPKLRP